MPPFLAGWTKGESIELDKRKIDIISIIITVSVFIIFFTLFLKDDFSAHHLLRDKRSSLKEAISRDQYAIEAHKNKAADVSTLEKEILEDKQFLLKEDNIPYFLNYVSSLARRHQVVIISIEPGQTVDNNRLTKTTFTAELKGGFPYVYNFLYHLEDDWRGVKIEALSIDKNREDSRVDVKLTLAVLSIDGFPEKT